MFRSKTVLLIGIAAIALSCKSEEPPGSPNKAKPAPTTVAPAATPAPAAPDGTPATPAATSAPAATPTPAKPAATASTSPPPTPAKPEKPATDKKEIVFDPLKPPAGYVNCHRNHCHKVGGGVASYQQVMQEMGATKIIQPKRKPMPKAPVDVAGPPADVEMTPGGVASKVLNKGDGVNKPGPTSVVTVHYTGWTTDGKAFDSSVSRGRPATFPLNRVIPGWSEGLQQMSIGEERRLWIPQHLAYKGRPGRPAGMLVFDVELLAIK